MPVPAVPARAAIREHAARQCGQPERVVQFAISEQARVGGHPRSVELQFQAAVEKGPEWPMSQFHPPGSASEPPLRHPQASDSYGRIVPIRHQVKRSLGKCGLRCLSGIAPVTKRSGKSLIVVRRLAVHNRLQNALYCWRSLRSADI